MRYQTKCLSLLLSSINHSVQIRIKSGTHGIDSVLSFTFHHWSPDQVLRFIQNFLDTDFVGPWSICGEILMIGGERGGECRLLSSSPGYYTVVLLR